MTMTIEKIANGSSLTIAVNGRLDTLTAPALEEEIKKLPDGIDSLVLDFTKLEYVSSAGLRVLLSAHKSMAAKKGMKITHINEIVREVFEVTGFSSILNIDD